MNVAAERTNGAYGRDPCGYITKVDSHVESLPRPEERSDAPSDPDRSSGPRIGTPPEPVSEVPASVPIPAGTSCRRAGDLTIA